LADARFQDRRWWTAITDAEESGAHSSASPSEAADQSVRELMTEVLMLAWYTARSDPRIAAVLLGLTPEVAGRIAGLGPPGVRRIAARQCAQLQLRWSSNVRFWKQLIAAAQQGDQDLLTEVHLYGLQLTGAVVLGLGGSADVPPT
jgi:hypothetical protein